MGSLLTYSLLFATVLYLVYKRVTRISLADIRGPKPESFWLGNLGQLLRRVVGEVDFAWQEQFGGVAHIKGPLGQDILWFCDPRALQFIHNGGYKFPKAPERLAVNTLTTDHGLVTAQGANHKRQRKVMLPAFGMPEARALFPIFSRCAETITTRWRDELFDAPDQSSVYNIPTWLSCATLDAIGEAAFDHKFGAIDNQEGEFVKAYQSLMIKSFGSPKDSRIIFQALSRFLPFRFLEFFYNHIPLYRILRENRAVAHKFAREMLSEKSAAWARGTSNHDVMSILVRANHSEDQQTKLSEYEMVSQMRTLLLAGHDTTSSSLTWGLYELAKHPDVQTRLRNEIHAMEATIRARGRTGFNSLDMESMPYTQACLKEMLRIHPAVYHTQRMAGQDMIIPLSKPIITNSGKEIQEVPVPKGTRLFLSIAAYNRDKTIWGEDAHEFNPERWLNQTEKRETPVGVFSNLSTFSGGPRACIGWRFAVNEIQAFMVELVANFEFSLTEECKKIRREPCLIMAPTLEGELAKGAQMPLKVTLVQREA